MAYQATVVPVMIASPGDVEEERKLIRNKIHEWNDDNAEFSKVILIAKGWETHSSPELGIRPQELINMRVLKECDLLIGVFWTRFGTPTGKSPSGTVEEIEEHVAAGKPAMIYFSSKPIAPESIDKEQFAQVKEIKEKWRQMGLIETYDSLDELNNKLSKHLQICLSKNPYLKEKVSSMNIDVIVDRNGESQKTRSYALSDEAIAILKAAASRDDGTILKIHSLGGCLIQTGGRAFGGEKGRDAAKWESALNQLESKGLVVARGYKGEVFELTHEGWQAADSL